MNKIYGARFGTDYENLKELNSSEGSNPHRITIYNDAYIANSDVSEYKGKKNFRFVVGASIKPSVIDTKLFAYSTNNVDVLDIIGENMEWEKLRIEAKPVSGMVFDTKDRSLYLFSFGEISDMYIDSKCNFSSTYFENSLAIESNMVYKVNYLDRKLVELFGI
jgi:hypothetical protein